MTGVELEQEKEKEILSVGMEWQYMTNTDTKWFTVKQMQGPLARIPRGGVEGSEEGRGDRGESTECRGGVRGSVREGSTGKTKKKKRKRRNKKREEKS